jgi:hypothetical protein
MFRLDRGMDFFIILIDSCVKGSNDESFDLATVREDCNGLILTFTGFEGLSKNLVLNEENFVLCGSCISL